MEKVDYINVIEALANGYDPATGEVFPEDSPYNQPIIIRALFAALNDLKGKTSTSTNKPKLTLIMCPNKC